METLCNLMYANVGRVTTELLLNSRGLSVTIQKRTDGLFDRLFPFSGMIVILHDLLPDTG